MCNQRSAASGLLAFLIVSMLWYGSVSATPFPYTFTDTNNHLITTITNGGSNLPILPDQEFQMTNDSGETWFGFRLYIEGFGEFGDFDFEGIADYVGPAGLTIYQDLDGIGRAEQMLVYFLGIGDGSTYTFEVDLLHWFPEGLVELDVYGDPIVLRAILRPITGIVPEILTSFAGPDALLLPAQRFELTNDTSTIWEQYEVRLGAFDADGNSVSFARFESVSPSKAPLYQGPGDPAFFDTDQENGPDVLRIRGLSIQPGASLVFETDIRCFPPQGLDRLDIVGRIIDTAVAVPGEQPSSAIAAPTLSCVPNPFNPATVVHFELAQASTVSVRIYDVAGRLVRTLLSGESRAQGQHELVWRGEDNEGRSVASGVYLCRLEAKRYQVTQQISLVR